MIKNAEVGMRNAEKEQGLSDGVIKNAEVGMRNAEVGMRKSERERGLNDGIRIHPIWDF